MSGSRLTVIICTFNRAEMLSYCLQSLIDQKMPLTDFEVLVVNNNSSDETESVISTYRRLMPNLNSVFEPQQGAAYARNAGLMASTTEWVAYLDDDAKVHDDWLVVMDGNVKKDIFDCFGGVYLPWHFYQECPEWFDDNWASNKRVQEVFGELRPNAHISSGNCAIRREAAIRCGGFPTGVGMSGNRVAYGEETALFEMMKQNGYRLGFDPSMQIDHCVMPYKYSLRWQLISSFASGRDYYSIYGEDKGVMGGIKVVGRFVKTLFVELRRGVMRCFRSSGRPWAMDGVNMMKRLAASAGEIYGFLRVRNS